MEVDYWTQAGALVGQYDPYCLGIIVLGLNAPVAVIEQAFAAAGQEPRVKGFAVGRTLFAEAAKSWLGGYMDDRQAIDLMRQQYRSIINAWRKVRAE